MESPSVKAIDSAQHSEISYCKFITANDTGETGGHQAGFHIHKDAWPLAFESEGEKGENKEKFVTIRWQNDFETESRFIYYGVGTRNEYRLTRFGRGFPYLSEDNVGDLLVFSKKNKDFYEAFILQSEDDIEAFFTAVGITASQANRLIASTSKISAADTLLNCYKDFIGSLEFEFPTTFELSTNARRCYIDSFQITEKDIIDDPDNALLSWIEAEYNLFKALENDRYGHKIKSPFKSVQELVVFANTILNRRKSRAGKSLEHHLSKLFELNQLRFSVQINTEENKKPDFIFPGIEEYHDSGFNYRKLIFLASKTTCKDRWRQVLNEADRIPRKHLFTLQQGISKNQLKEMYKYGVQLVIPKKYLLSFPAHYRPQILTLESFIKLAKSKQS